VLRFRSGEELFDAAEFFASQPLPHGRRVGVVSNSAGLATLAVDACATRGLVLGEVGAGAEEVPVKPPARPAGTAEGNPAVLPIRVTPGAFGDAVGALLADPGIDAVMAYYIDSFAGHPDAILRAVGGAAQGLGKPVVASVLGSDGTRPEAAAGEATRVPNFLFPESCASVLTLGAQRREWLSRPLGQRPQFEDIDREAAQAVLSGLRGEDTVGSTWLSAPECERILAAYGIPFTATRACAELTEAVAAGRELAGPLVLKADSAPPAHASDIDAVLLGLTGDEAMRAGWRELERRVALAGWTWRGAVLEPLVAPGADLLVGMVKDPDYGPVVALGLGGRQAGLGSDATVRLPPVSDVEADELIDASASVAGRLAPFRGQSALDRGALRDVLLRFARLLRDMPEILEADLNPTRWMADGCTVLDARIRVGRLAARPLVKTW